MFPVITKNESICYRAKDIIVQKAKANDNIVTFITSPELAYLVDAKKELVVND